jgi:hypothetical protein
VPGGRCRVAKRPDWPQAGCAWSVMGVILTSGHGDGVEDLGRTGSEDVVVADEVMSVFVDVAGLAFRDVSWPGLRFFKCDGEVR